MIYQIKHWARANTVEQAKKNILEHYDLGNDFYQLWLDDSWTYSSAIFENEKQSLQDAQMAKYDRIIEQLDIRSGDRVLEIGCGWGGFIQRAVEKTDCHVTGYHNSNEQNAFVHQRIGRHGLQKNTKVCNDDYRNIEGQYDKIVSIEMIEAVGQKYWPQFFGKLQSAMKSGSSALIQAITIDDAEFDLYASRADFIQQYVFLVECS